MKSITRWIALFALFVSNAAWAAGSSYSGLYVFGDSLVDPGNAFIATGGAEASPANGYYGGRFSNGFNFADYLNIRMTGAPTAPLLGGGLNMAIGGATAAYDPAEAIPSLVGQIGYYNTLVGTQIDSNALVLVTFGGNDVRATIQTGGSVDFSVAAASLGYGLDQLYQLGARNFLIVGAPDIGLLPQSATDGGQIPGRLDALTDRSEQINLALVALAGQIGNAPGASAAYFDLFAFEHALLGDPAAFGLSPTLDVTTPCQILGGGVPQTANCGNALYFDGVHPTTQVHQAIATAMAAQLGISAVPEPQSWGLLILGVGAAGAMVRRRRRALMVATG